MSAEISIYNHAATTRRGRTASAFSAVIHKELMREHTLGFSIKNTDPIYTKIREDSVFECEGQMFDITGIDDESGEENVTQLSAEHISYRLNKYNVTAGYAFVGTLAQIAEDILKISGADAEFSVVNSADLGTVSFQLNNDKEQTARAALLALQALGVEVEFDNFTVCLPERIGKASGKVFRFGEDLTSFRKRWERDNGWTYTLKVADIQQIPGFEGIAVRLGDSVSAEDSMHGRTVERRVVTYDRCIDDPSQNEITLGVFIRDDATESAETEQVANDAAFTASQAKAKADNSLQEGERYSNVYINHTDGFVAENKLGTLRTVQNGDDCFAVQVKKNGKWVNVTSAEEWGMLTPRLTTQESKDKCYATVGESENVTGIRIIKINPNGSETEIMSIGDILYSSSAATIQGATIKAKSLYIILDGENGGFFSIRDKSGAEMFYTGTVVTYDVATDKRSYCYFNNGLLKYVKEDNGVN